MLKSAFTIVELVVVVAVIAILAVIGIIGYNGVTNHARETALKSDLDGTASKLALYYKSNNSYPSSLTDDTKAQSPSTNLNYTKTSDGFCLEASDVNDSSVVYYVTNGGTITKGVCPPTYIQTITSSNCPNDLTMVADKRDNHTYWVKKLADGKCWMLTNLAYAGGGTNTYSDVIPTGDGSSGTLSNGTSDGSTTYTNAKYYVHSNANPTTEPTNPSTSTDGGATNPQYGYLYNWCAAMGSQSSTSACANASTPLPNTAISICPSGWRLPTGGGGGEFVALNTAVNGGLTNTDTGIRSNWYGQKGGNWSGGTFHYINGYGYYWASTQGSASSSYEFAFQTSSSEPASFDTKDHGSSVRCIAV